MNGTVQREKHNFDATGQIPGRLASETAILLMGKHKVGWQPNLDVGDFVEVTNVAQLKFTGKKLEGGGRTKHSGFPGGLKTSPLAKLFQEDPAKLFRRMVYNMLPKNRLRKEMIKRLTFKQNV